jgi:hypothetical protein
MLYLAVLRSRMLKARQLFHWSANEDIIPLSAVALGGVMSPFFSLSALIL